MANSFNDDFVKAFDFMGITDLDDNDVRKNINNRQSNGTFKSRNSDKRSLSLPDTAIVRSLTSKHRLLTNY